MTQTGRLPFSISLIKKLTGSQRRWGRLAFLARLFIILSLFNAYVFVIQPYLMSYTSHSIAILFTLLAIAICFKIIISISRLHDFGAHGAFALLMLVPAINILFMLFLGTRKGDILANKYGSPTPSANWEKAIALVGSCITIIGFFFLLAQDLIVLFYYY